jgi:putative salt-induced outer membrane protein YdiY
MPAKIFTSCSLKSSFYMTSSLLIAAFLISTTAFAEEEANKVWSGKFKLGMASSVGNTNLGKLNVGLLMKTGVQKPRSVQHTIQGEIAYAERSRGRGTESIESKNAKELNYKVDYYLSNKSKLIGYVGYEDDKKAKLDSQIMIGGGYERIKLGFSPAHRFSVGIGAVYLDVKYADGTPGFSEPAIRGSLGYRGKITDTISVKQKLVVLSSKARVMSRVVSSLNFALTEKTSLALQHKLTHNSLIPATTLDKTDSKISLNVVIGF